MTLHYADLISGIVLVAPTPATTGVSVKVRRNDPAMPLPDVPFRATFYAGTPEWTRAEIVEVTAVTPTATSGDDVWTITRAIEGPSAKAIALGWGVLHGPTKDLFDQIGSTTVDSVARSAADAAALQASTADSKAVSDATASSTNLSAEQSRNSSQSALVSTADSKAASAGSLALAAGAAAIAADTDALAAASMATSASSRASVADSKAVSDSLLTSTADSKATSAGSAASVADSKAVSDSLTTSTADSKAGSASTRASVADSKAVSDSVNTSVADSKAESAALLAGTDSVARSKADSAGTAASIADSKAVSDSLTISTADSKGDSGSTRASVADSKAVSDSLLTSTADSKATSAGTAASAADSKAVSDSANTSIADSKAVSAAAVAGTDSVARSKADSAGTAASGADSKAVSDSLTTSTADSKAESAALLAGTDSIARSKADSSGTAASAADSKAVSDSLTISTADSKGDSAGTRASIADSKAISDSLTTSTADSKGTSAGSAASVADSKAVSDSLTTSSADSKGASAGTAASVADSKAVSDSLTTSTADSKGDSASTRASTADSKALSAATADLPLAGGTMTGALNVNASVAIKGPGPWVDVMSPGLTRRCSASLATTTCSIANGSNSLSVGSASGWSVGMGVRVILDDSSGFDSYVTAINGTTFTLNDNAPSAGTFPRVLYHNDTLAIQDAIDLAGTGNIAGRVYLPPGSYYITQIKMRSQVNVCGAGIRSTTLFSLPANTLNMCVLNAASVFGTMLQDITLSGNKATSPAPTSASTLYWDNTAFPSSAHHMLNVRFVNAPNDAINLLTGYECQFLNIEINACNGHGIVEDAISFFNQWTNVMITNPGLHGIRLYSAACMWNNVRVNGAGQVDSTTYGDGWHFESGSHGHTITGWSTDSKRNAVYIDSGSGWGRMNMSMTFHSTTGKFLVIASGDENRIRGVTVGAPRLTATGVVQLTGGLRNDIEITYNALSFTANTNPASGAALSGSDNGVRLLCGSKFVGDVNCFESEPTIVCGGLLISAGATWWINAGASVRIFG